MISLDSKDEFEKYVLNEEKRQNTNEYQANNTHVVLSLADFIRNIQSFFYISYRKQRPNLRDEGSAKGSSSIYCIFNADKEPVNRCLLEAWRQEDRTKNARKKQ